MRTAPIFAVIALLGAAACGGSKPAVPIVAASASPTIAPTPTVPASTPAATPTPTWAPAPPSAAAAPAPAPVVAPAPRSSSSDPGRITYLAFEGVPARWDPCRPIRYRVNPADAPEGGLEIIQQAVKRAALATGLPFRNDGTTNVVLQPYLDPSRYGIDLVIGWQHGLGADASLMFLSKVLPTPKGPRIAAAEIVLNAEKIAPVEFTGGYRSSWGWGTRLLYRLGNVVNIGSISAPNQVMSEQSSPNTPTDYGPADRTALTSLGKSAGCLPDA